jgi:hypothetical protein
VVVEALRIERIEGRRRRRCCACVCVWSADECENAHERDREYVDVNGDWSEER